jgi:hypothetical protein
VGEEVGRRRGNQASAGRHGKPKIRAGALPTALADVSVRLLLQALLQIRDPGLECHHAVLQVADVTLDSLPPTALVGERAFDAPKRVRDDQVLLVDAFEAAIDLVEMTQHLSPEIVDLALKRLESAIDGGEMPRDHRELLGDGRGLLRELLGEGRGLAVEAVGELLVLAGRHASV